MHSGRAAELIVGSVQLGLAYGAANRTGKPDHKAALRLVQRAADAGVAGFDTARAYGDSEERLGEALKGRRVRTVTKLAPLGDLAPDAPPDLAIAAVDESIARSLVALQRHQLDCLLLHRASHLSAFDGVIWKRLQYYLAKGTIRSLGVSVQSAAEAHMALRHPNVEHIQLPFNILDWRWADAGVIAAIHSRPSVTIHVRSVFLQGVLTSGDLAVWPRIEGIDPAAVIDWLNDRTLKCGRQNVADLCLAYVRAHDWIHGVVIGMETEEQLEVNLELAARAPLTLAERSAIEADRPRVPEQLLDPARWPRR